ncbi:MAG: bifunctional 4-hydroxy-2-oxoglutarate aldolase/2-dehydro-3-deoxy-phosphogluconate aldolase [Ruminococcaceae bacterium]|nr:bifunctional 4-hydroxy-2-oxoglutarate aldolase/2-dehydro-3-deoxy-phosphogluconate aldolase [Oscillospiraceae bacterium]
MSDIIKELHDYGLVPVIKITDVNNALPLAKALADGGLNCAEITFRTACAKEAIAKITKEMPDMLVGAGTVLTPEQADEAIAAGSKFIVSPGFNPRVVKHCLERGVPVLPGCATPSEVEQAIEMGLKAVKFFPAEAAGGINMIKSMAAPYQQVQFMPTGGINEDNMLDYLSFGKIIACGGSFMVKDALIDAGNFEEITRLTRNAVMKMLGFKLVHVGINCESSEEAQAGAKLICSLFGLDCKIGNSSTFAGSEFEFMHSKYLGTHGHIAIATNFPDRARAYLERMGIEFDESTAKYDAKGNLTVIYLKGEVCGFALHLVKKK